MEEGNYLEDLGFLLFKKKKKLLEQIRISRGGASTRKESP